MQLVNLGGGAGFLKAGIQGFQKSGKTYTANLLAIGTRAHQKKEGPIAMFDTEAAAQYVAPLVKRETGKDLVGYQSRALKDAIEFLKVCVENKVSVAIIDSVTHLWREVCDSYLKQVNDQLQKKGRNPRTRLEFQDWGPIKAKWQEFADLYLNLPLNVIICGRAGYEYDFEEREDGVGKDLVKTGVKMKTESEFGYEASLLVQMERVGRGQNGEILKKMVHRATVLGDRFGDLDGKECDNPTFEFFRPFVERLVPGSHASVDTTPKTDLGVDVTGDAEYARERKNREIFCEEIQGALTMAFPSQSAQDKMAKATIIHNVFGTHSWVAVQGMDSAKLRAAKDALPAAIEEYRKSAVVATAALSEKTDAEKVVGHFSKTKKTEAVTAGKEGK